MQAKLHIGKEEIYQAEIITTNEKLFKTSTSIVKNVINILQEFKVGLLV